MIIQFRTSSAISFPYDTSFEKDIPWRGWMRVISEGKSWWFNCDEIVYVGPGLEKPSGE